MIKVEAVNNEPKPKATYQMYKEAIDNYRFHGTENYYKFGVFPVVATDGANWFAETFEAYWLLEYMAAEMMQHKDEHFWVMDCHVENEEADIKFTDGNDNIICENHINATDLPAGDYTLWACNYDGPDLLNHVIMLNTEY